MQVNKTRDINKIYKRIGKNAKHQINKIPVLKIYFKYFFNQIKESIGILSKFSRNIKKTFKIIYSTSNWVADSKS